MAKGRGNNTFGDVFSQTNITTFGFLGLVGMGVAIFPKIPTQVLVSAVGAYGSGTAFATAFYRTRNLLKDGTDAENKFGDGALAGVAILAGMAAAYSAPSIIASVVKEMDISRETAVILGLLVACAGFIQSRSSLSKDISQGRKPTDTEISQNK